MNEPCNESIVSIIVPIYNTEKYLKKCIDSIRNQTYSKIEIILIDDGSTDGSGKICDDYARIDSRINAVHIKNAGVSNARNIGMKFATGSYITFCDSDDYMEPSMINTLYYDALANNADIAMCNYNLVCNGAIIKNEVTNFKNDLNKQEFYSFAIEDKYYRGFVWSKLFKRSAVYQNDTPILFNDDIHLCEDVAWLFEVAQHCTIFFYNYKSHLYNYVQHDNNFNHRQWNIKLATILKAQFIQIEIAEKNCPSIVGSLKEQCLRTGIGVEYEMNKLRISDENTGQMLKRTKRYLMDVVKNSDIGVFSKIKLVLRSNCPYFILKYYKKIS